MLKLNNVGFQINIYSKYIKAQGENNIFFIKKKKKESLNFN